MAMLRLNYKGCGAHIPHVLRHRFSIFKRRLTHSEDAAKYCMASSGLLKPAFRRALARPLDDFDLQRVLMLSPFERMIAKRYLWPGKGEAFIALVASISIGVVMLSVAMLVV
ncbi:MAG: hypothetical protein AAF553_08845, partial [Pseudomonadota bacterium]